MILYACQLACIVLVPLSLLTGQGLIVPPLLIIAYLIHRQAILEQQINYLLTVNSTRETVRAWRDQAVSKPPQAPRVKGV